jgi:hypothetical protein
MRLYCYIVAALLACLAGEAIAQDLKAEYCAGVHAFDNQAASQLLNVSQMARAGYADEKACQALIYQCTNAARSNTNVAQGMRQLGACTAKTDQMFPVCAQVAATCGRQ